MRATPKIRRQSWKPRLKFPRKGKPRSTRSGVGLQRTSCRLNRLPEWKDPRSYITKGGRHRLFGEDYERLRRKAFDRAGGYCECSDCAKLPHRLAAPWHTSLVYAKGELAHHEHGARKSDELHRVDWMRHECHVKSHNCGGKPCPKKVI